MKMEQTKCSEMSAYKIQSPSNYPKESIKHVRFVFDEMVLSEVSQLELRNSMTE